MSGREAIEAAELVEAETRYLHQLAREAYAAGHTDGYRAGYRQADADQAARWNRAAGAVTDGPDRAEMEERRWGPGGREHFADPRPGDFPGRGAQPPSRTRTRTRNGGNSVTDTQADASPRTAPSDPAIAASDPGMFAALTYDEDVILYQFLYEGWVKQRAVYPALPELGKETSAVLHDLTGACRTALQAGQEPEAGQ